MKVRLEKLVDFNRNQYYNYYFEFNNEKQLAKSIYLDYELPVKFNEEYVILQINDFNFVVGALPIKSSNSISCRYPQQYNVKLYKKGNIAIFKSKSSQNAKSIFYYDNNMQTLEFNINYIFIPYGIFSRNYHYQKIDNLHSKISKLLTRPEFARFCKISYDTIRNWNEKGKLLPIHRNGNGRMYFSRDQILQVQELQNARFQTKEVYLQLISAFNKFETDQVLHINFLKKSIKGYTHKHYYTLQKSLNQLIDSAIISRVRPGYYRLLKRIDY